MLTRENKTQKIEELTKLFSSSGAVVVSNYSKLSATEITDLRKQLNGQGIKLVVAKNSLVKIVLEKLARSMPEGILDQPIAIAFGADEVETSKILYEFSKANENLKILGGIVNSENTNAAQIKALALLPGRDELYAKVVGSIAAPISGFVNVVGGNLRGLVSVLGQYQSKIK